MNLKMDTGGGLIRECTNGWDFEILYMNINVNFYFKLVFGFGCTIPLNIIDGRRKSIQVSL